MPARTTELLPKFLKSASLARQDRIYTQSFECVDALTSDEHDAIQNAEIGQAVPDEQL